MLSGVLAEIFGPDVLIVLAVVVVVLLFGGSKLPKLARGLGTASHEFKKGMDEGESKAAATDAGERPASERPASERPAS